MSGSLIYLLLRQVTQMLARLGGDDGAKDVELVLHHQVAVPAGTAPTARTRAGFGEPDRACRYARRRSAADPAGHRQHGLTHRHRIKTPAADNQPSHTSGQRRPCGRPGRSTQPILPSTRANAECKALFLDDPR
jgi:hypothetical protein